MPATKADLYELRSILSWLRTREKNSAEARIGADALSRAVAILSEPDIHKSTINWVLGALLQSVDEAQPRRYRIVDFDLWSWAIQQIRQLLSESEQESETQ